jgi:hypothetical protein
VGLIGFADVGRGGSSKAAIALGVLTNTSRHPGWSSVCALALFVDSVNNLRGIKVEHRGTGQYSLSGVFHSSNLALYSSICISSAG